MIVAMPLPWIMAKPIPCITLAAINVAKLGKAPAKAAARTKIRNPVT